MKTCHTQAYTGSTRSIGLMSQIFIIIIIISSLFHLSAFHLFPPSPLTVSSFFFILFLFSLLSLLFLSSFLPIFISFISLPPSIFGTSTNVGPTNVGRYKPKTYKRRTVQTSDQYKHQTGTNVGLVQTLD